MQLHKNCGDVLYKLFCYRLSGQVGVQCIKAIETLDYNTMKVCGPLRPGPDPQHGMAWGEIWSDSTMLPILLPSFEHVVVW